MGRCTQHVRSTGRASSQLYVRDCRAAGPKGVGWGFTQRGACISTPRKGIIWRQSDLASIMSQSLRNAREAPAAVDGISIELAILAH